MNRKRQIIKRWPTTICRSTPSEGRSIGMLDQLTCCALPSNGASVFSVVVDIPELFFDDGRFQARTTSRIFGLHVDYAKLTVFAFPHRGHHP